MDKFILWGSTEGFSKFIYKNTLLKDKDVEFKILPESDASKPSEFHKLPTHIKNIQYLDSPDLIIEFKGKAILSVEISQEAGTGHNVFQRFSRIAAAVENEVPCIYIYPEAVKVFRKNLKPSWDKINPLIFYAMKRLRMIYSNSPVLLYYYPSYYRESPDSKEITKFNKGLKRNLDVPEIDDEMKKMFQCINQILECSISGEEIRKLLLKPLISDRIDFMDAEYEKKKTKEKEEMSPISSVIEVPSEVVAEYILEKGNNKNKKLDYFSSTIWQTREKTKIYKLNAEFRGDPYPGCLAALDYMITRIGKTYEDRDYNLVIAWGDVSIDDFNKLRIKNVKGEKQSINVIFEKIKKNNSEKNILTKNYEDIEFEQLPRYFMQLRFGSMFSKPKEIRVYSYFADAILFSDGALWREG